MQQLNDPQQKAILHDTGPALVLAGAGSGKTKVVIERIAHLLEKGVSPQEIVAVTFTNKAAKEMQERLFRLYPRPVLTCTFHSLGAKILRESIALLGRDPNFTIYDEEDKTALLKKCIENPTKALLKEIKGQISQAKNALLSPTTSAGEASFLQAYRLYEQKLEENSAVDFDDLLYLTARLLLENPTAQDLYASRWRYVLIDEYQDTNFAQYTLAKLLVSKHHNIFAVGDPDQSIYSWRGAIYQNILRFEKDFPGATIVTLDQNYRSQNGILRVANSLISHNENRYKKDLWSDLGEGEKPTFFLAESEREETSFVVRQIALLGKKNTSLSDIAILYRTNAQSRPLEDLLRIFKIPYTIIGGVSFYARKEIKDILAFCKILLFPQDTLSFLRTAPLPQRGLGAAGLEKLLVAAEEASLPILSFCRECLQGLHPSCKLSSRQKSALQTYLDILQHLSLRKDAIPLSQFLRETISSTNYLSHLQEDKETLEEREENLDELLSKAKEWEEDHENGTLAQFLEELSLYTLETSKEEGPSVQMMTVHNSKGLEFRVVFLVGLEEGLFPHANCKEDPTLLEEERRLCYVGITRAMQKLYLTAARFRYLWGYPQVMALSRFLREIPKDLLQKNPLA